MITVDITPHDFDDVAALFERLSVRMTDMTPVMQDLGELLINSTKQRFPEGVSPDGTPWAPKSQATIDAFRSREGRKKNASIDFRPLFGASGRLFSEFSWEAGPSSVEIGSSLVYAAAMQFGMAKGYAGTASGTDKRGRLYSFSIPWGNIPARPFLGISDEDEVMIRETISDYLDEALQTGN